jgi:hypothetical protein
MRVGAKFNLALFSHNNEERPKFNAGFTLFESSGIWPFLNVNTLGPHYNAVTRYIIYPPFG